MNSGTPALALTAMNNPFESVLRTRNKPKTNKNDDNMKRETKSLFAFDWTIPHQTVAKITPLDAERVLSEHNEGNRFRRVAGTKYIAQQIKNGEWIENHPQPICFSNDGKLIDGQHRMAGIAMSNQAVWASIRFGVDPDVIRYMDTGISRTLGDRVAFVENPNVNKFIASLVSLRQQMTVKGKASPEVALSLFHEMSNSYKAIAEMHKPTRILGTAVVGLAFVDYHFRHGEEACEMYAELFKLTTECQPAQALRNFLSSSTIRGTVQYPYIVAACLANHQGRELKLLRAASWK